MAVELHKRSLVARDLSSWGGFPLLAKPCPADTISCGGSSCCPNTYQCNTDIGDFSTYCCPSDADCKPIVKALKACADNSWGMFLGLDLKTFCCLPDSIGTYSSGSGPLCMAKNLPIPASILANSVSQRTGTNTATSSHGKTSATAPVSSSTTAASVIGGSTHSGISQGAIIAIAVLATVVGMLLLFIIWMFLKRRNKRQSGTLSALSVPVTERTERISYIQATSKTSDPHVGELSSQTVPRTGPIYEVDNALCIELDTVTRGISTQ